MIKNLDWATELRRHATTREIKLATAECNITSVLNDADDWASLVTIIIMDEKNFEKIEKLIDARTGQGSGLTIPSCVDCDGISKEREKKDWSKKGMASIKGSQRKSHSLLAQSSPRQDQPVSMGCYRCTEFSHFIKECSSNPNPSNATAAGAGAGLPAPVQSREHR